MGEHISPHFFRVNLYLYISTSLGNSSGGAGVVSVLDSDSFQALIVKFLLWQALWFTRAFCCFSRSVKPPFLCLVFGDRISLQWYLDCGWMREAKVLQENWWVFGATDRLQDCCSKFGIPSLAIQTWNTSIRSWDVPGCWKQLTIRWVLRLLHNVHLHIDRGLHAGHVFLLWWWWWWLL